MNRFAHISCLLVTTLSVSAAPLLPEPFKFPKEPKSPIEGGKRRLQAERPKLNYAGRAVLDIDLNTSSVVPHKLLTISLGRNPAFQPSEIYQLIPPGHPDGHPDYVILRMEWKKVVFKVSKDDSNAIQYASFNVPGFTIVRDGDALVVSDLRRRWSHRFQSTDGGFTWRVFEIRHLDYETLKIECVYDDDDLLREIVLPNGRKHVIEYELGLPVKVLDPNMRMTKIEWDDQSQIKSVKTWIGPRHPFHPPVWPGTRPKPVLIRSIQVECDPLGRLLSLTDTDGDRYSCEYRANRNPKEKTSYHCGILSGSDGLKRYRRTLWDLSKPKTFKSNSGFVFLDGNGSESFEKREARFFKSKSHVMSLFKHLDDGKLTEFERAAATNAVTAVKNYGDSPSRRELNEHGLTTKIIHPNGTDKKFAYDDSGRLVETIDEAGRPTRRVYEDGKLTAIDESGIVTRYFHDAKGFPVKTVLPNGAVHLFEWDDLARLKSHVRPGGVRVEYEYFLGSDVISSIKTVSTNGESSRTKTFDHTARGYLKKIVHPDGSIESFNYEGRNLITRLNRNKTLFKYVRDDAGRLVMEIVDGKPMKRFEYDKMGRRVKSTGANGDVTQYSYDVYDRVVKVVKPDGSWVVFDRDPAGRVIRERRSDRTSVFRKYDERGRLVSTIDERGESVSFALDPTGLPLKKIRTLQSGSDGGEEVTVHEYDDAGRRIRTRYPDGSTETIHYQPGTRNISVVVRDGVEHRYVYDAHGRITSITRSSVVNEGEEVLKIESEEVEKSDVVQHFNYGPFGERVFDEVSRNDAK